ncbi:hypothetical protein Hanom_Chr04g00385381 [Helianthus anomalus]
MRVANYICHTQVFVNGVATMHSQNEQYDHTINISRPHLIDNTPLILLPHNDHNGNPFLVPQENPRSETRFFFFFFFFLILTPFV